MWVKLNKYCILNDFCIPSNLSIKEEWDYYIAENKSLEDEEYFEEVYKLSKNFDYFEKTLKETMYIEEVKVFKVWDNYVKSVDEKWCWWSNLEQEVIDKDWNKINDFLLSTHISSINIWNIKYVPTLVWKWWFWQPLDSFNNFKVYRAEDNEYKIYKDEEEFQTFVEEKVLNEDKKLYGSYIANYKDYPWIYVIYNSVWYDDSSFRVVWLWTDEEYLSENILENWNYYDLSITNKIIWYYSWENAMQWLFDKEWNRITKVSKDKLAIFKMKKLNEKGNYLVYFNEWYKLQYFVEMCKPVVYYYSKNIEENTLTLNLKKWDYFTNLIPELDDNNSWNFVSDNSQIKIENQNYDYMYYSLVTVWYTHNKDWWIVKWANIVEFFEEKLDKINFNKKEKTDFIDFWKNEYETDKYYFVSFKYKDELDKIIKLNFSKKVDSEFRVLLDSYVIKDFNYEIYENFLYKNVWDRFDQYLIERFERWKTENEVFEWGWVLEKENETIIK